MPKLPPTARLFEECASRTARRAAIVALPLVLFASTASAETTADVLSGLNGWTGILFGAVRDGSGDSQAGAADTDIVADAQHASLYTGYADSGTAVVSDDKLLFRARVGNPTAPTTFGGVLVVGIDANLDGRIDLFLSVDGRNSQQAVRLFDPGTGENSSASTTTTSPLPTGWLPNNGVYPFASNNFATVAVGAGTDPHWTNDADLGDDGKNDAFVSWAIPIADLATVLAKPSPVDRNGNVGPRGTTGIAGYNRNTSVRYVCFTQTQTGPINGDIDGVGASYDKNASFSSLGVFTTAMSASSPVVAGPSVAIAEPIATDDIVNAAEASAVTLSGSTQELADGSVIQITITDETNSLAHTIVTTTSVSGGAWSKSGLNLSGLDDGLLQIDAMLDPGAGGTAATTDTVFVLLDRTAPALTIADQSTALAGTPAFTGTADTVDLPAGSSITVAIDPDNSALTANDVVYTVLVATGGTWSLDLATATPTSGSLPNGGLKSFSRVTVTGTDDAGNVGTAIALNHPTVTSLTTNNTKPTVSGTWTNVSGDVLSVRIDGTTYTTSTTPALVVSTTSWSITPTGALAVTTFDVVARGVALILITRRDEPDALAT